MAIVQLSALSPLDALLTDTGKKHKKQLLCYFAGEETIHLNNPKCAAGAVLFIIEKGRLSNTFSCIRALKPPGVVACYVRSTSARRSGSPGQAEGQRAECVLMTVKQRRLSY